MNNHGRDTPDNQPNAQQRDAADSPRGLVDGIVSTAIRASVMRRIARKRRDALLIERLRGHMVQNREILALLAS